MTDQEIRPFVGKPARVTLADGRILAGLLLVGSDEGHGHTHYAVDSDPVREGDPPQRVVVHGGDKITMIEDASTDPAATP